MAVRKRDRSPDSACFACHLPSSSGKISDFEARQLRLIRKTFTLLPKEGTALPKEGKALTKEGKSMKGRAGALSDLPESGGRSDAGVDGLLVTGLRNDPGRQPPGPCRASLMGEFVPLSDIS